SDSWPSIGYSLAERKDCDRSKSEIRISKSEANPKFEIINHKNHRPELCPFAERTRTNCVKRNGLLRASFSNFGLASDFDIRISNFAFTEAGHGRGWGPCIPRGSCRGDRFP